MNTYKRAVGLFYSRDEAEAALRALKNDGFDMKRVNLIARDADKVEGTNNLNRGEETVEEGNNAREGAGAGATSGAVLGGIGGLLIGLGTLVIPGVGPILVAGEAASTIASTLAGAGIGAAAGGIVGGLVGMGIPEEKAKIYSDRVKGGSYLIMVNGTDNEVRRAERILNSNGIEEFGIYDAPDLNNAAKTGTTATNTLNRDRNVVEPRATNPVDRKRTVVEPTVENSTSTVEGDLIADEPRAANPVDRDRSVVEPKANNPVDRERTITADKDPEVIIIDERNQTR